METPTDFFPADYHVSAEINDRLISHLLSMIAYKIIKWGFWGFWGFEDFKNLKNLNFLT